MFGGVAAMVNGNMFGGLFGRAAIVKLSPADQAEAMKLDGAEPFDPMGNGRVMGSTVFMPEAIMDEPGELRDWLHRAFEFARALPRKKKKKAKATPRAPSAGQQAAKAKAKAPSTSRSKPASHRSKASSSRVAARQRARRAKR